jgi:hypothetical protein
LRPPALTGNAIVEVQIALRLPSRSKPLHIPYLKKFLEAIRYSEPIFIGSKRYCFSLDSFQPGQKEIIKMLLDQARFQEQPNSEKGYRIGQIDVELFGIILAEVFAQAYSTLSERNFSQEDELPLLPGLYEGSLENPLRFSFQPATLKFVIEYMKPPVSKILLNPMIMLDQKAITVEEAKLLECVKPGMLSLNTYYNFGPQITRTHLKNLRPIRDMTIPEPLFGSFVENAMPELTLFAQIENSEAIESFVTLPFVTPVKATCDIVYLDGELEASLFFHYEGQNIPGAPSKLSYEDVDSFVSPQGILARNLVEERKIIEDLFQDFIFNADDGIYVAKSEKKIVEFMTDIIPRNQDRVKFNCPQNLLDQFIYDQTQFFLQLNETSRIDVYEIELTVKGAMKGVKMDLLWECIASKRAFIEIESTRSKTKKPGEGNKMPKILVLDLEKTATIFQLFDELGITVLDNHKLERPLWSLANIDASHFAGLPVEYKIANKLVDIRKQMIGEEQLSFHPFLKRSKQPYAAIKKKGLIGLKDSA